MKHPIHCRRTLFLSAILLAGALGIAAASASSQRNADVEGVRETLAQLVETRRMISKETSDWKVGKELLGDRIEVLSNEVSSLRAREEEARSSIAEADKKREELLAENAQFKASSEVLVDMVAGLESRTKVILAGVPVPLRDRVRPLSQRLGSEGEESKLSLSERFQNVVGILNEVNKFNREVNVFNEIRELAGGETREVMSLYLGVSCGYYANAEGTLGGFGQRGASGWAWKADNSIAPAVATAIRIYKNELPAAFVPLPTSLDGLEN